MAVYDKVEWHLAGAVDAGQPPEHAATHIGLFLGWLARRDMLDTSDVDPVDVAAVQRGELPGSALLESFDDKLLSIAMTFEGDAFAAARYQSYLDAYGAAFADRPDYSVAEDAKAAASILPILDGLYEAWIRDGRPGPTARSEPAFTGGSSVDAGASGGTLFVPAGLSPDLLELFAEQARSFGQDIRMMPPPPPPNAELAALLPIDLTDPTITVSGHQAVNEPRTSRLRRALDKLGVDARHVDIAAAIGGGPGPNTLAITLYRVPGISAARLAEAFESVVAKPARSRWLHRKIAERDVRWVDTPEFSNAFWARDGLVVHVGGTAAEIERVIPRLP